VREGGDEVDTDELLDLDFRGDRPAPEALLGQRLAVARTASDRVGDSPDWYLLRLLHLQRVVLRNLRDRLAAQPGAGDSSGLRERFCVVADAGTKLAELEQHRA
jgi:hypothetical protein